MMQAFDLNIGEVLEHWTVPFAIREVIANALDEQTLTGTGEPGRCKRTGRVQIRGWPAKCTCPPLQPQA